MTAANGVGAAPGPAQPAAEALAVGAVPLAIFLDQVAGVLRQGLPATVWLAAAVLDVRTSTSGHTLELSDPAIERGGATLRVFLPTRALIAIRRDLGVAIDPVLLIGMTTCLQVRPAFSRRWHLGGQVEALSRDVAASLRARYLERVVTTLKREMLWDRQRRYPVPRDVTRLSVIHPAGAAGWEDIAGELGRWQRAGLIMVRSHEAAFEGDAAPAALVAAIRAAAAPVSGSGPDLVLVVRGGGARMSLAALDEESVARAILACPVPVICGTGHARDETLADRVAFRRVDTPSKAVVLVADMMRCAVRRATRDWECLRDAANAALLTEAGQLDARYQAVAAAADREHVRADRSLASLWSGVRVNVRGGSERLLSCRADLDRHRDAALHAAPQRLQAAAQMLRDLLQASIGRAAAALGGVDDGLNLAVRIEAGAVALLDREDTSIGHHRDEVERAVTALIERNLVALDQAQAAADAADPRRMLARGYVLVTDPAGRLLTTRAIAEPCERLRLRFADGELTVRPEAA